eukprot:TRINITY_DN17091_c0_g3_i1.p3 TRINITY_DN17091_c0_g3~~TRINITY_DN17091_c0_g3_i1.p3  ORF type:complete len:162 (-),score=21.55 TRINITY_DN17091_c0_g3_i1:162-647(-)
MKKNNNQDETTGTREVPSSVEVYGFAGWLGSYVAFIVFLLWALIPNYVLEYLGITYYPSKDWAVILPCWIMMFIVYAFWMYEAYNMTKIDEIENIQNIKDNDGKHGREVGLASCAHNASKGVPALVDIPVQVASAILFGNVDSKLAEQQFGELEQSTKELQ